MEENKSGITVPALERGLNVLELLAAREQPISLKFISKELNIPSASAFRLMKNLTARGYAIEKNGGQILYSVGPKLLEIAYRCNRNMSLSAIARDVYKRQH